MSIEFAQSLIDAGIPVVVCAPNPDWHHGSREADVRPPKGWALATADKCDLTSFRPDVDTLAMVAGHGVDVVDVDTKDDGSVDNLPPFQSFGETRTPSGGAHFYVRSTGIAKMSPLTTSAGHVGDYVGGTPEGGSRMLAYLPGSTRPKYAGDTYSVTTPLELAALLESDPDDNLVAALMGSGGRREGKAGKPAAKLAEVESFLAEQSVIPATCNYGRAAIKGMLDEAKEAVPGDPKRGRHGWALKSAVRAVELIRAGCATSADLDDLEAVLDRIKPEGGTDWHECLAWGLANADGGVNCGVHGKASVPTAVLGATAVPASQRKAALAALLADLRTWQHLPDPTHIVVALATAATKNSTGEPCWVLMVAPPSSGKTEAVRILDDAADARLDEVTSAGLLGWSKGKDVRPSGVLTRVGERALVTFGDLSSLLATSDRGGRDQVFGLLRRAYDGHVTRDVSPPGKFVGSPQLEWSGRLTVIACVTGAIDRYAAHSDQLGPRWVYVRIPDRNTDQKRLAARMARRQGLADSRARARAGVADILASLPEPPELPEEVADDIEDAALVTAWGRGSVPRNGYSRREIEGVPVVEEPMRLVQQLSGVARGLLALGLPTEATSAITRRVALDSMPATRFAILATLAKGELLTTAGVARASGLDRKVARMTLEELAVIGIVEHDRSDDSDDEQSGTTHWWLAGDDGEIVSDVFAAQRKSGGWDETWVYTSTSPQIETDTGIQPTLRPTPDDVTECVVCGEPLFLIETGRTLCARCQKSGQLPAQRREAS